MNGGTRSPKLNSQLREDLLGKWLLGKSDRRRALYTFPGDTEGDLGFNEGEIIEVTEVIGDGEWLKGQHNGQTGIFPANFVEEIPTDSYISNFDFEASQDGDLGFVKGQTIKVLEKMGDWWKGETQEWSSKCNYRLS